MVIIIPAKNIEINKSYLSKTIGQPEVRTVLSFEDKKVNYIVINGKRKGLTASCGLNYFRKWASHEINPKNIDSLAAQSSPQISRF